MPAHRESVIILPSEARTTAQEVELDTHGALGLLLVVNVTDNGADGGLTPKVHAIDPVSGSNVTIFTASAAITADGQHAYLLYPTTLSAAADEIRQIKQIPVPRRVNVELAVANATAYTYSVGAILLD